MFFVYLVRCADNSLYCGITNNLEKRLRMHNGEIQGGAKYTRSRRPVFLEAYTQVTKIQEALQLEREVKKKRSHQKIDFLKYLSYNNIINKEKIPMDTLTFSFPPLNKGDFCHLFFTKKTEQTEQTEQSLQRELCTSKCKPHDRAPDTPKENFESSMLTNSFAYSHNIELALKMPSGTLLYKQDQQNKEPLFSVQSIQFHTHSSYPSLILQCLRDDFSPSKKPNKPSQKNTMNQIYTESFHLSKKGYSLAVITLSDKGFHGKREDRSGPALLQLLTDVCIEGQMLFHTKNLYILPDETHALRGLVSSLAYTQGIDCIITTGGTGLSARDITPDALLPFLQSRLHGFEHAMMAKSIEKTPHAMLSRAFAGIIHKSLLFCVPGSVKAATENIEAILPALPHALAKLGGDMSDCGIEQK